MNKRTFLKTLGITAGGLATVPFNILATPTPVFDKPSTNPNEYLPHYIEMRPCDFAQKFFLVYYNQRFVDLEPGDYYRFKPELKCGDSTWRLVLTAGYTRTGNRCNAWHSFEPRDSVLHEEDVFKNYDKAIKQKK